MSVRFGVCTSFDNIPALIHAGYDYIECGFSELVAMSEEEFKKVKSYLNTYEIKAECFNAFAPGSMRLTGPKVVYKTIEEHCKKGMMRAAKLGCKILVIGSGASRRVPDNFDLSIGYEQLVKVLNIAGGVAAEYGITVVIEPLQTDETNLINTVQEGIDICKKVNKPNVKGLADFFHIYRNGDSLDAIRNSDGMIAHFHLARAHDDRNIPYEEDIPQVAEWAKAVKASEYEGRLSLEGNFEPDFEKCIIRARKIIECFNK